MLSENSAQRINESLERLDTAALKALAKLEIIDDIYAFLRDHGHLRISRRAFRQAVTEQLREDGMMPDEILRLTALDGN